MRRALLWFGFWFLFAVSSFAQTTVTTGLPPFGSFDAGHFDAVNLQILNANFSIPIVSTPGRGTAFNLSLVYDSLIWQNNGGAWTPVTDHVGNPIWGWKTITPLGDILYSHSITSTIKRCSIDYYDYITVETYSNYVYRDPAGTTHYFGGVYWREKIDNCTGSDTITSQLTGYASDASGMYINISSLDTPNVWSKSGILLNTNAEDTNGNIVSKVVVSGSETDWKDTSGLIAGRVIQNGSNTEYHYYGPLGADRLFTLKRQLYSIKTAFGCSGVADYNTSGTLPQVSLPYELDLPDGTKYSFTYEPTPGSSGFYTGRMLQVTVLTGGTIQYSYPTTSNNGINCADGTVVNLTRTLSDGVNPAASWNYVRNLSALTTTVTTPKLPDTPSANDAVYTFNSNGQETTRKIYANSPGTGTPLRTVNTTWATNGTPATEVTILDDGSTQSETDTVFDSNGLLDSVTEYGFGSGTRGGLIRTTALTYQTSSTYTSKNILNLVTQKKVTDAGNMVRFLQNINYDESGYVNASCITGAVQHDDTGYGCSFTTRGLPTSIISYANAAGPSGALTQHISYDSLGNPISSTDAAGNTTSISYTDNYSDSVNRSTYARPTTLTQPVTSGVSHISHMSYYYYLGLSYQNTDQNGQVTTSLYDLRGRPTQQNFPDGGQTSITYNSATSVTSTTKMNSTQNIVGTVLLDGLGRTKQTQLVDPQGIDYTDTTNDLLGRAYSVSNPYRSTSDPTYGVTTTAFDVLGRPMSVTLPDGSKSTISYTKNTVTATDPAGKTSQSTVDAPGRLTQVTEDPGASPHLNFVTTYAYDALNNLTNVVQNGSRNRTFTYDGLSRVTRETNPETGTINYFYDASGHAGDLTSRVAPLPNQTGTATVTTTYTYDLLHRLTQKSYSDGTTLTAYFAYEQTGPWGPALTNPVGRLTEEWTGTSCCATGGAEIFGYDPIGRIIFNEQYTATMGYRPMNYTYDLAGNMATYTDGVGETYTQTFDTAGHGTQLNSSWVDSQHPATMLSGISYNPANAMTKLTYGNGLTQTAAFNNALQPCRVNLNSSSTALATCTDAIPSGNVQDFNYGFNAGSSDNGNVATWTASGQQAFSRSFTYDALNRLASLNQSSGNATGCSSTFSLSWNYDAWGNRTDQNVTGGTCNAFHATVNSQNQLSGSPYQYDAAGNMIHDGSHTYFYDAENRLVQVDGTFGTCSSATACYLYDALGHRTTKSVGTAQTNYIYGLDGNVISEVDQNNIWKNVYLRLNGRLFAQYTVGSPRTAFVHTDHLGSTRLLTDLNKNVVQNLDYLPFGETNSTDSGISTHKFTGDERDSETSLDHTQFRQYTSQLARWMSPDPAGLAAVDPMNPQSWNRYSYVLNDPMDFVDPLGLATCVTTTDAQGNPIITCTSNVPPPPPEPTGPPSAPSSLLLLSLQNCNFYYDGFGRGPFCAPAASHVRGDSVKDTRGGNSSGNNSWAWNFTKSFVKGWFTQGLSDQPGSCTAVFLNSAQNSVASAARSVATNTVKYGSAVAAGLANAGPQAEEAAAAMVAGGQLSPAVGAVATNIITGTAPLAAAAAPYVVRTGGYFALGAFDYVLGKALISEIAAIKNGQCKP
jgi:RHS repeat-associated protein